MDDVTWGALTLSLTVVGAIWTYLAYQRRGVAAALKGAGLTALPLAAYLTNTLQMFTRIVDAVADWATRLVFSPTVWLGVVLAGLGVLLFGAGRALESRGIGTRGVAAKEPRRSQDPGAPSVPGKSGKSPKSGKPGKTAGLPAGRRPESEPVIDDDLADIEAILRKRGIT